MHKIKFKFQVQKKRLQEAATPHVVFLSVAVLFGFLLVFMIPPMQSPDEVEHFYRSYQVSQLNFKSDEVNNGYGGVLPVSVIDASTKFKNVSAGKPEVNFDTSLIGSAGMQPLNPEIQASVRFDNTSIYSPVPYLPQALGVGVGRVMHFDPVALVYLGRLTNLLAWILMVYLAIRITPFGKWSFAVVALNPVALFLASTLSSDAASTGLIAMFVAIVLSLCVRILPLSRKEILVLAILPILIVLTKNAYLPIIILLLLIPNKTLKLWIKGLIIVGALATGVLWNVTVLSNAENIPEYFGISANISSAEQARAIIHNPSTFIGVLVDGLIGQSSSVILPSYSGIFGWLDTPNPYWVSILFYSMVLMALLYRGDDSKRLIANIGTPIKFGFLLILMCSVGALFTTLYLGFTEVGKGTIDGIQGRYFIPLTFLIIPIVLTQFVELKMSRRLFIVSLVAGLCLIHAVTLLTIIARFYL